MKYFVVLILSLFFVGCESTKSSSADGQLGSSVLPRVKNQEIEEIIEKSKIQPVASVSNYQAKGLAAYFHLLAEEQVVSRQFGYAASLYALAFKFDQNPYYSLRHVEVLSLNKKPDEARSNLKRYRLMFPKDRGLIQVQNSKLTKAPNSSNL